MHISCEPNINLYSFCRESEEKGIQFTLHALKKPRLITQQSLFKEELRKTDFSPTTLLTLTNIKNSTAWRKDKKEQPTAKQAQIHKSYEFNLSSSKQNLNLGYLKYNCVGKRFANPLQSHTIEEDKSVMDKITTENLLLTQRYLTLRKDI